MGSMKGIFIGFVLWILWIGVVMTVNNAFPAEVRVVSGVEQHVLHSGPVVQWLWIGALPMLLMLGNYLMIDNDQSKKIPAFNSFLSALIAFVIWLAIVPVISSIGIQLSFEAVTIGGFILMILVLVTFKLKGIPIT